MRTIEGDVVMTDKTWRHTERVIAKRLNGRRTGLTGKPTADVVSNWLSVEVKHRKQIPAWLKDALTQARNGADGRLPLVVLHECGDHHANDLVLLRLADFEDWFGDLSKHESER